MEVVVIVRLFITVMIWWMFCGDDDSGGHSSDGRDFDCGGHGIVAFEVLTWCSMYIDGCGGYEIMMVIELVSFVAVEVLAVKMVVMVVVYNAGCRDSWSWW